MKLQEALNCILSENDLDRTTKQQYKRSLRRFEEYLGRQAVADDLTHEVVNAFLPWLAETHSLGKQSVKNHRRGITRVWNYLAARGICETYDQRRLLSPKARLKPPVSWKPENVTALLRGAKVVEGTLRCGIPAKDFLRAWVLVGYQTGLRPIDLRLLQWEAVDFDRRLIQISQNKTGNPHTAAFDDDCAKALSNIDKPSRERVFPIAKWGVRRWELILFAKAEQFGFRRTRGQALGTLRKSHGTEVCRQHGLHVAAESLGHVSGSRIARAHYVAPDALRPGTLPPPLPAKS